MSRVFFINGETMVAVKGASNTGIPVATFLGLTTPTGKVRVTLNPRHMDILVDAWGPEVPPDVQCFGGDARISFTLVHFDRSVLDECWRLSFGGAGGTVGLSRAGSLLGGNVPRFAPGNSYISLNLFSPVAGKPWRFFTTIMTGPASEFPLGTEKSEVVCNFRAIAYGIDPWGNGTGSLGTPLFDYNLDS